MITRQDVGKLFLRLGIGVLMLFHGVNKLIHGFDFISAKLAEQHLPTFLWLGVPVSEVIAPLLIIFGVMTRISSLLIGFTMLMTFYLVFGMGGFALTDLGAPAAELNLLYLAATIALFFLGSGSLSLYKGNNKWLK